MYRALLAQEDLIRELSCSISLISYGGCWMGVKLSMNYRLNRSQFLLLHCIRCSMQSVGVNDEECSNRRPKSNVRPPKRWSCRRSSLIYRRENNTDKIPLPSSLLSSCETAKVEPRLHFSTRFSADSVFLVVAQWPSYDAAASRPRSSSMSTTAGGVCLRLLLARLGCNQVGSASICTVRNMHILLHLL